MIGLRAVSGMYQEWWSIRREWCTPLEHLHQTSFSRPTKIPQKIQFPISVLSGNICPKYKIPQITHLVIPGHLTANLAELA